MCYISKIKRMTDVEKSQVIETYHNASDEAVFPPETLFLVYGFSLPWLQKKRCEGGGIPFFKPTPKKVFYKKSDVIEYINNNRMLHTA